MCAALLHRESSSVEMATAAALEAAWALTNIAACALPVPVDLLQVVPALVVHLASAHSPELANQCAWAIGAMPTHAVQHTSLCMPALTHPERAYRVTLMNYWRMPFRTHMSWTHQQQVSILGVLRRLRRVIAGAAKVPRISSRKGPACRQPGGRGGAHQVCSDLSGAAAVGRPGSVAGGGRGHLPTSLPSRGHRRLGPFQPPARRPIISGNLAPPVMTHDVNVSQIQNPSLPCSGKPAQIVCCLPGHVHYSTYDAALLLSGKLH